MRNHRNTFAGIGLGWALSITAILAIPLIAFDAADRSPFFWHRVLWSAFLATLAWSIGGAFVIRATTRTVDVDRTAGVLPALGLLVMGYAAASFIVMLLFMLLSSGSSPSKAHLVIQVALASATGVICALISLARGSASSGISPPALGIPSPPELASIIEDQEQRFKDVGPESTDLSVELKRLRETVSYSLSRVGSITTSNRYQTFSIKVKLLCGSSGSPRIDEIQSLLREAKSIAAAHKR